MNGKCRWTCLANLPRRASYLAARGAAAIAICAALLRSADCLAVDPGGVWNVTTSGAAAGTNLWSTATNWRGSTVASGTDATADFSQLTLSANETVHLDSSRTIGSLIFGDQGSKFDWTLDNNQQAANTLTLAVSSGQPTIAVNNGVATISAAISGTQGFTLNPNGGSGTLVLTGPNSNTGETIVNSGTLTVSGGGSLGSGALEINATGAGVVSTVNLNTSQSLTGLFDDVTGGGVDTINLGPQVTLTLSTAPEFENGPSFVTEGSFAGKIAGSSGALVILGDTLILSGANTFGGGTSVYGGLLWLQASSGAALYHNATSNATAGSLTLAGATLTENSESTTPQYFNGTTILPGSSLIEFASEAPTQSISLGPITRTAAGGTVLFTYTLASTSSPNTNGILGGWATVTFDDGDSYSWAVSGGAGSPITGLSQTPSAQSLTVASASTGNYDLTGTTSTFAAGTTINSLSFTGSGAATLNGTGTSPTLVIASGGILASQSSISTGIATLTGQAVVTIGPAGTLTTGNRSGGNDLIVNSYSPLVIAAQIIDNGAPVAVTISGRYTTTLANSGNTYSGVTYVNGPLLVTALANGGAASTLGASSNSAHNLVINGGLLEFSPTSGAAAGSTDRLFTIGPGGASLAAASGSTMIFNGNTNANNGSGGVNAIAFSAVAPATLNLTAANITANVPQPFGPNIFAPIIADSGTGQNITSLVVGGSYSAWTLTGANTYTGGTTVVSGTLFTAGGGQLGPGFLDVAPEGFGEIGPFPPVYVNLGTNQTISSLLGGQGGVLTIAQGMTLTVNQLANSQYSGTLAISGAINKQGNGTLTLDGVLTLNSGNSLTVGGGTLLIDNINASPPNTGGNVTASVSGAGTLELAGSVNSLTSFVNVANNSTAAAGLLIAGTNQQLGQISGSGNTVVGTTTAAGSLTANQIVQNSLTIHGSGTTAATAGMVTLAPSGSGSTSNPTGANNINYSSTLTSLSIDNNGAALGSRVYYGTLDIGNNGLVIAYGSSADPYVQIDDMIRSGYNGGTWTGTGITSTLAAAGVAQHISTPLNIGLEDFTPGKGNFSNTTFIVFEGQTVTTNAVLLRLTYMDDITLAGDMSPQDAASDALIFAANYGTGTTWSVGDLVHSGGPVNSSDALLFAANYQIGLPSLDGTSGGEAALGGTAAVPEPSSMVLVALAAIGVALARRPAARCCDPSRVG